MRGRAAAAAFLVLVAASLLTGRASAQSSAALPPAADSGMPSPSIRQYPDRPAELLELMLWDTVRNERDPAALEEYLRQYPSGHFATIAKLRLSALRRNGDERAETGAAAAAPPPRAEEDGGAAASGTSGAPVRAGWLPPPAGGAGRAATAAPDSQMLPSGDPIAAYDAAFGRMRAAEYGAAATMLRRFIDMYPDDPLTANAQYWLGEAYLQQGDYAAAASAFAGAYARSPGGPRAADALFKLAATLGRDGRPDDACGALYRLQQNFPTTSARLGTMLVAERRRNGC